MVIVSYRVEIWYLRLVMEVDCWDKRSSRVGADCEMRGYSSCTSSFGVVVFYSRRVTLSKSLKISTSDIFILIVFSISVTLAFNSLPKASFSALVLVG